MKKFMKENWFIIVVAVFFVFAAVYFTYDQNKDNLPGKKVNGKDVIFTVDDENYTADDLYDQLAISQKKSVVVNKFFKAVVNQSTKYTEDEEKELNSYVTNVIYYYTQSGYTESYLDAIAQYYYGYNTFSDYVYYSTKLEKVMASYIKEHIDTLYTEEMKEAFNAHVISYVVISLDDPANPTAEEQERIDAAKKAWAEGTYESFADFAKKYSEDSNASNGGKYGYIDDSSLESTSIDQVFVKAALALKEGETTDWVYTEKFGYYLIHCDSTKLEDYIEEDAFVERILGLDEDLSAKIFWDAACKLNVEYESEEMEEWIEEAYNPEHVHEHNHGTEGE